MKQHLKAILQPGNGPDFSKMETKARLLGIYSGEDESAGTKMLMVEGDLSKICELISASSKTSHSSNGCWVPCELLDETRFETADMVSKDDCYWVTEAKIGEIAEGYGVADIDDDIPNKAIAFLSK